MFTMEKGFYNEKQVLSCKEEVLLRKKVVSREGGSIIAKDMLL